jgi:DNA-binding SARP family transcriptional activator/WD40 repeat protein
VRLLGPTETGTGGSAGLSPRDRVVLSALSVRPGDSLSAERLADALWGESPPSSWAKVVQGCVVRLRRVLGTGTIETTAAGYRLSRDHVDLDRDEFEDLVRRGREHLADDRPESAAELFAAALELWRGRPFSDLEEWPPGRLEAARLDELRLSVQEDLLQARLDAGEHREVAAAGTVLVGEEPWRERRWEILALAQYRCGRQADALASIRTARRSLGAELGLDPGSALVRLEHAILGQDPGLAPEHEARLASQRCPWKGLASYDAEDRDTFFGRAAEVESCLQRLESHRLLVLTGPSGCGKSSLMNAGLAPGLRSRRSVATFTPGRDGPSAMAVARAGVPGDPVLLVDQLEEVFTSADDSAAVAGWLDELASYAVERAPVVVTLRADHVAHLTTSVAFAQLAERGVHLVAPLTGAGLVEAIEGPARLAGLRLERGLVDLLRIDAEDQPGALPLLSFALAETWQRREGSLLTVAGYRASGGIRAAVARAADRLYEGLSLDERTKLRWLLLRMVTVSANGEAVRAPLPAGVVAADPGRARVMDLLVRARLVTSLSDSYELAHEALVRAWPRLRAWLDDDTAGQRVWRHLAATAQGWESLGRPEGELYQGARLVAALEWLDRGGSGLTGSEADFLEASRERARSARRALEEAARHERRQNRRLRTLLGGVAALLVLSLLAGWAAVDRSRASVRERDSARSAELAAQHESLVGRSLTLRSTNRQAAALLAAEAFRQRPDALAQSALLGTFTAAPGFLGYRHVDGVGSMNADLVPGTRTAVVSAAGGQLFLLDLGSGVRTHRFAPPPAHGLDYAVVKVSSDGRRVAQLLFAPKDASRCGYYEALLSGNGRGCTTLTVYDVATGRRLMSPRVTPFNGGDVAIDSTGSTVAVAGGLNGDVVTYDVEDGTRTARLAGLPRPQGVFLWRDTAAVTFDRRGNLYLGSMAGPVRELAPRTLRVVRTLSAPRLSSHNYLVLTRGGLLLAAGDRAEVAFDVRTGAQRWTTDLSDELFSEPCPFFVVAELVGRTYCGNYFGQMDERDLATGQRTGITLDPQLGSVGDLVSDGRELVAFSGNTPVYSRWRLDGSGLIARTVAAGQASSGGYDLTGTRLLVTPRGDHDPARVIDLSTGQTLWKAPVPSDVSWLGRDTVALQGPRVNGLASVPDSGRPGTSRRAVVRASPALTADTEGVFVEGDRRHAWAASAMSDTGRPVRLQRFDTTTGRATGERVIAPGYVQSVVATPGAGSVLVTFDAGDGWTSRRFDLPGGTRRGVGMQGQARTALAADGTLVGSNDTGDVTEFDPRTLAPVASLPGSRGGPSSLQFSADGSRLVVTTGDQSVQVYDVATRARLGDALPSGALDGMTEGWLRPDGLAVAVNARQGVVEWTLDPRRLVLAACRLAGRNLTSTEWRTYVGTAAYHVTCPAYRSKPTES